MGEQFFAPTNYHPDNVFVLCDRGAKIRHNSQVVVRLFSDGKPLGGYMFGVVTTKRPHPLRRLRVQWVGSESGCWVGLLEPDRCEVVPVVGTYQMQNI